MSGPARERYLSRIMCCCRLLPLLAVSIAAPYAGAQDYVPLRHGVMMTVGAGVSSAGLSCTPACSADRRAGPTYQGRLGVALSPQLSVGIEANSFQQNVPTASGPGSWRLLWATVVAQWYLHEEEDTFVKVGFGTISFNANPVFSSVGAVDLTTRDFGFVAGLGRDYRLGEHFGVTLYADYLTAARSAALAHGNDSGARLGGDLIVVGLGFSLF